MLEERIHIVEIKPDVEDTKLIITDALGKTVVTLME